MRFNTNTLSARPSKAQRGVGLVELMVGITVGLIVTAGAAMVATRQINEHRRLMLEVQMQQDLRIAADLMQQDLRRAGYRGLPTNSVWQPEREAGAVVAKEAASSPYTAASTNAGGDVLTYRYAKPPPGSTTVNTSNALASNEQFGVRWNKADRTLEIQLGAGNWQPITDKDVLLIDNFVANIVTQEVSLEDLCDPACKGSGTCPKQTVRRVNFLIKAISKNDPSVQRTLNVTEKLRSDEISGACPA